MISTKLDILATKIDELNDLCLDLEQEKQAILIKAEADNAEHHRKHDLARTKIEAIIDRLKTLENEP